MSENEPSLNPSFVHVHGEIFKTIKSQNRLPDDSDATMTSEIETLKRKHYIVVNDDGSVSLTSLGETALKHYLDFHDPDRPPPPIRGFR